MNDLVDKFFHSSVLIEVINRKVCSNEDVIYRICKELEKATGKHFMLLPIVRVGAGCGNWEFFRIPESNKRTSSKSQG